MLRIRMARRGTTNRPFYHLVAADSRKPRDGDYLEKLGTYNPLLPHSDPARLNLNLDRIKYWLSVGAQPSERIAKILSQNGVGKAPAITVKTKKSTPKKKSADRAEAKASKAAALKEAAAAPAAPEAAAEEAAA